MRCLHCGDCCNRMSPKNGGKCPDVVAVGKLFFCRDYENRPTECVNHSFSSQVCPVGKTVLNANCDSDIRKIVMVANEIIDRKMFLD